MKKIGVLLLAVGAFVMGSAELIVGGILNVISDDLNISVSLAGQLITAFSLAFAIGTPIIVSLTSRVKRKSLVLYSLAVFLLGNLTTYLSTDFRLLLLSRVLVGLGAGVYTVVAFGSAAKLVSRDQVGRAISAIVLAISLSMVIGNPLGIAVAQLWDWRAIFAGLSGLALIILILIMKKMPEVEGDSPVPFFRQFAVLKNLVIALGFIFSFFFTTSASIINSYIAPYIQNTLRLDTAELGCMMLALGLFSVIGSRAGGAWTDRWGAPRSIYAGLSLFLATSALLPFMSGSTMAGLLFLLVWMFAMATSIPAIQTYFIGLAPDNSNLVLGMNMSILHLGVAIGAGIGGVAVDALSTVEYHPWLSSVSAAISLVVAAFSIRKSREEGRQTPTSPASL
ncbi:MFS transporter [Cohnella terricola]|uniref:MFS transporter n=1 Tax=Cohnella terricola TaxID=1289167 RepID=A0A559JQR8_9BACL|nr:MFS transporter [Cohnella terricola]TVY02207.1 MFS transporter [Cohnella terricola]